MSAENPISSAPSGYRRQEQHPNAASLAAAGYTSGAHFQVPDLFPESPIANSAASTRRKTGTTGSGAISSMPADLNGQGRAAWAERAKATIEASIAGSMPSRPAPAADAAAPKATSSASAPGRLGDDGSGVTGAKPIPARAADTTADDPWPVGHVAQVFTTAISRWPALWMIGQIVEINVRRRGSAYITLHDDSQDISMEVVAFGAVAMKAREFKQGDQILVHGRANVWVKQTRLSFRADEIRAVGRGRLIEQINQLRMRLKGEGLFDPDRKKPLPEFPKTIGIICGPGARAESDIIRNAQLRWPTISFVVEPAAVQGIHCPPEVIAALKKLDARDDIDVIIVARGGGSFEDLLGFSDEGVVRQIAACSHPVVTAIGHEADWTLADQAADLRASTPTDAAKRVVPDVMEQLQLIADQHSQMNAYLDQMVSNEQRLLDGYRTHPSLTEPERMLEQPAQAIAQALDRLDTALRMEVDDQNLRLEKRLSSLEALSPLSTLRRGYAIVQDEDGRVVTDSSVLTAGQDLSVRLRTGEADVTVKAAH